MTISCSSRACGAPAADRPVRYRVAALPASAIRSHSFARSPMKRLAPLALLVMLGCANYSNTSIIMDPTAFPAGHYGLYERKSDQLVLTCELKPGETFGFEYAGKRPSALR